MGSTQDRPVIVAAKRTPLGAFLGSLATRTAPQLGAVAISAAVKESGFSGEQFEQVYLGNVISAGVGQAPARQAAIAAGLPVSVGAVTVNKVCGSGLMAVELAGRAIRLGEAEVCVAGGMESMSSAPYLLTGARQGLRLGHQRLLDAMVHDGLWDVYNDFHMGSAAELCARERKVSREDQDAYAKASYQKAQQAMRDGLCRAEIAAVEVPGKKGAVTLVSEDEGPGRFQPEKMATLPPAFAEGGTVTAANASSINDGAAALVVSSEKAAKKHGCEVLAYIRGFSNAAMKPEWFTVAPVTAIKRLLENAGLDVSDIDLFEINEAFAVVVLAVMRELKLKQERVNVRGGAIALGHPIGCSGARILVTLLHALKQGQLKRGVAAICLGGGEAIAMLVERP